MMNRSMTLGASLLLTLSASTVVAACTTSRTSADQCSVDAECDTIRGTAPGVSQCVLGVCQERPSAAPSSADGGTNCVSTEQCIQENGGKAFYCRAPGEGPCIPLETEACKVQGSSWKVATPIFVGVLAPLHFRKGGALVANSDAEKDVEGLKMAADEWSSATLGGLTVGRDKRPLIPVVCDTQFEQKIALSAFDHLTNTLGLSSILSLDSVAATDVLGKAIERKTFIYCDRCTGFFTPQETAGLVRTSYSIIETTYPTFGGWLATTEAKLRQGALNNGTNLRVAVIQAGAPSSTGAPTIDGLEAKLFFNGKPAAQNGDDYMRVTLPPDDASFWSALEAQVAAIVASKPDVIISYYMGRSFHLDYLPLIEAAWPAGASHKPRYIISENELYVPRLEVSVGANDELRQRITGILPNPGPDSRDAMSQFRARFKARYQKESDNVSTGLDGFYVMAFAYAASLATAGVDPDAIDGPTFAKAFARLGDPAGVRAPHVPSSIANGVRALGAGQNLDLVGTQFSLDWDPITGYPKDSYGVGCIKRDSQTGAMTIEIEGPRWNLATNEMEGTYSGTVCGY